MPETDEYGVASFVYRERRPFDPERFRSFLDKPWPGVIRAKGHFWLATRPDWVGLLSVAGVQRRCGAYGPLVGGSSKTGMAKPIRSLNNSSRVDWDGAWGDRRQELVFIGSDMDEGYIRASLDACLAHSANGFDPQSWRNLNDPFPAWQLPNGANGRGVYV